MVQVSVSTALGRRILNRWRTQGFDIVNQFPSGFCSPLSSRAITGSSPEGYTFLPIDSPDAVWAVARAIERGASYTYRELGAVEAISAETLELLRDVRVLVVDDRSDTRDLVDVILETCGASVETAPSVRDALDALDGGEFDLLVSDIMMPDEDGFELMRRLRERPIERGGGIPAIALTALDEDKYREQALEAGFQIFLIKPIAPAQLVRAAASLAV
jgi:CheY-like chemotaxis protein